MSEEKHADIIGVVWDSFPTFGAGQEFKNINKTALALEDEPLCFAAGVDVAKVVEVVLRESGHAALVEACEGAMRISELWRVDPEINLENPSEGQVLDAMSQQIVAALALAKKE